MSRFWPSTKPWSRRPLRNPRRVVDRNTDADETPAKYTIKGRRAASCARTASGHAAAAPPSSVMICWGGHAEDRISRHDLDNSSMVSNLTAHEAAQDCTRAVL